MAYVAADGLLGGAGSATLGSTGVLGGALLLPSSVVGGLAGAFLPGISIVLGAAGGAAAAKLIDGGLPDETLKHLGRGLTEEHSALVILVDSFDREAIERILLDNGGQIVSHELDASAADALAAAYAESGDESMEEAAAEEEAS